MCFVVSRYRYNVLDAHEAWAHGMVLCPKLSECKNTTLA